MRRERLIIDFLVKGDLADFYMDLKVKLNELQKQGSIEDYRVLQERILTIIDFEEEIKKDE